MASKTFVIGEVGSTWECDLTKAFRLIRAAKECGADAVKFQFTSNPEKMAARRGIPDAAPMYRKYLAWPQGYIPELKAYADEVGIEWMCTVYIPEDIGVIAPYVKRFKISAYESQDAQFIAEHLKPPWKHEELIISLNPGKTVPMHLDDSNFVTKLHCMSFYPTAPEHLHLNHLHDLENKNRFPIATQTYDGLSDHTANTLTGALAVAAGATVIEKHIRLFWDTPKDNPDYPHSLIADWIMKDPWQESMAYGSDWGWFEDSFQRYVMQIRLAEKML